MTPESYPRHQWKDTKGEQSIQAQMGNSQFRRCKACGVKQERAPEYVWMRYAGKGTWHPSVSPRCIRTDQ